MTRKSTSYPTVVNVTVKGDRVAVLFDNGHVHRMSRAEAERVATDAEAARKVLHHAA